MAELPKQELLTKLLKMTTSANDAEALVAMRKANLLLSAAGWDWDRLIAGKITVIADPFQSAPEFTPRAAEPAPAPSAAQRQRSQQAYANPFKPAYAQARPAQSAPPPPPPPPQPAQKARFGGKANLYAGYCYCCGQPVNQQAGYIFNPQKTVGRGPDKWMIVCDFCDRNGAYIGASPAKRQAPAAPSLGAL